MVAVDLNPYAVRCARENSELNNVRGKMDFYPSGPVNGVERKRDFDLILFNAPYLPSDEGEAASWIGRSWAGGANGRQVVDRFISQAPSHLKAERQGAFDAVHTHRR